MAKTLVLAEKPSVGRDIARVLGCNKKLNGALEGNRYIVTWALGHLVTLADPEKYDKRYKDWDLKDLPIIPDRMSLVVIGQTAKQFKAVQSQMNRNDVQEIVIATDAGREGELVARWIIQKAGIKKPLKRLWITEVAVVGGKVLDPRARGGSGRSLPRRQSRAPRRNGYSIRSDTGSAPGKWGKIA